MNAIEIKNVTKRYSNEYELGEISLNVPAQKVFALLGPNGAGKTTLVKLILNLMKKNSGQIFLNGSDSENYISRNRVSFIPEKFTFHPFYTTRGVLEFFAKSKGVSTSDINTQVENAMDVFNIRDLEKRKLGKMSKGQMQRVGLATILLGESDIIILDEPFSGLDPIGIKDLKDIIAKLRNEGKTLFINSHILMEMEAICDEFAIIHKGKLLAQSSLEDLRTRGIKLEDYFYSLVKEGAV